MTRGETARDKETERRVCTCGETKIAIETETRQTQIDSDKRQRQRDKIQTHKRLRDTLRQLQTEP